MARRVLLQARERKRYAGPKEVSGRMDSWDGLYYRPIKVTTPGAGWVTGYCDPWFDICHPGGWVGIGF
jgi:hypothetical protein